MYVIGTAGHVDHGKSVLVRALTGIDPDRLPEEKERGMTIDLGFAWLKLPGGQEVGIVDVPGHERFIKNMLAGVGGIDLALLVVAADEGVMPQTTEHLAILDLLQVQRGILVITKKDLVDSDWLEMVSSDVLDAVKGTALEGAALVACSGITGEGLDDLKAVIERELANAIPRRDLGRPRLSIDRIFIVAGFGAVVTGTLVDGTLTIGQEVEVLPSGRRVRVRGLQSHGRKMESIGPGTRTAINLSGIAAGDLTRGEVVALPGTITPTSAIDARVRALPSLPRPIKHNARVSFHTGASEVWGRVRLLEGDELPPGSEGWAQIKLDEPVALVKGDLFVLRDANDTIGGGEVVDVQAKRHRRREQATLATLSTLREGSPEDALLTVLDRRQPSDLGAIVKNSGIVEDEARRMLENLVAEGKVVALNAPAERGSLYFSTTGFGALRQRAQRAIEAYYRDHPLRRSMPREELRSRLALDSRAFGQALKLWTDGGVLQERGVGVMLPGHEVRLAPAQQRQVDVFLQTLTANPYDPPTDGLPDNELLSYLEEEGAVIPVGDVVFGAEAYGQMVDRIVSHLREQGTVTLAQVRDMFGTSRKYAQALLEHLDDRRLTMRRGDERVLRDESTKGLTAGKSR